MIGFRRAALNDLFIDGGTASTNLEDFFDGTGYAGGTAKLTVDLNKILGTTLTETVGGYLTAAFKKLFDVATPVLVASDVMRGTDSAALASICTEGRLSELDAANLPTDVAARATPAQVNAEVVDALATDTYAEPAQGAPAATTTLAAKINYLFKAWRNRNTQTASQYSLYGDDAVTVDHKGTFADDGTTADRGEIATGP